MTKENVEVRIFKFLKNKNIHFTHYTHSECRTSQESYEARKMAGAGETIGAKALLLKMDFPKNEVNWTIAVIPGCNQLNSKLLGALFPYIKKMRFAHTDEIGTVLDGLVPGTIPPFGKEIFLNIDNLIIDKALFKYPVIGFNAGSLTTSIVMTSEIYRNLVKTAIIADISI
jgi:prolyl-tRNA editing enzyme YbaK/EbsC (Cys-tRNA(Pro) deacylase)